MNHPKISVIMPVYNAEGALPETFRALEAQTFSDFEVILVDDGSTDRSAERILEKVQSDPRFRLLRQAHAGAGAARNLGLEAAGGDYVIFSDCDDLYLPGTLETLYQTAETRSAQITACNYSGIDNRGHVHNQTGVTVSWLPKDTRVFSWRDCPDDILRVTGTVVWNKLYRRDLLTKHHLRFDPLLTCNDVSFVAVSLAAAERVTYVSDHLIRYRFPRLNNPKAPEDVGRAVESAFRQIQTLPHWEGLQNALLRFGIDHYLGGLKKYVRDFSAAEARSLYRQAHALFNSALYDRLEPLSLRNGDLHREYLTVRKHDCDTMAGLIAKKLIVSLTTYPKRIGTLSQVLDTIYAQTKQPDLVILWLAREQFPAGEGDLPEALLELVRQNRLAIRWCADLKPHKKYFYAMQEYPEDLIVTIDDDLLYSKNTLACLYASYLLHPEAVSTVRAHLMVMDEDRKLLPYGFWIQETDTCLHQPSHQLLATGGAGALYPPKLLRKEFLQEQAVRDACLWADDLWLKAMELISDVPVVLCRPFEPLQYLPDTQEDSLQVTNVRQGQNDIQMEKILRWTDETFGPGALMAAFLRPVNGSAILGMEKVSWHIDRERRLTRAKLLKTQTSLTAAEAAARQAQTENGKLTAQLDKTQQKLEQTDSQLTQTRQTLTDTRQQLRQSEESKPLSRQLKAVGTSARGLGKLLYYLAWIPGGMTIGMMYLCRHGLKATLKTTYRKLFRR